MNISDSVSYLLSLGNEVTAMKLGLENIAKLLADLDSPHKQYLKVQVAGTNGKGSFCAFLNAICLSSGIKTGLYTSPHLISITERIQINGNDISEDEFASHATRVRATAEELLDRGEIGYLPTFFEQVTAIALLAFADAGVELAILETGLGGRLDATTAADAEIAAITAIDIRPPGISRRNARPDRCRKGGHYSQKLKGHRGLTEHGSRADHHRSMCPIRYHPGMDRPGQNHLR